MALNWFGSAFHSHLFFINYHKIHRIDIVDVNNLRTAFKIDYIDLIMKMAY